MKAAIQINCCISLLISLLPTEQYFFFIPHVLYIQYIAFTHALCVCILSIYRCK